MKIIVITYSTRGAELGNKIAAELDGVSCSRYLFNRYEAEGWVPFLEAKDILKEAFTQKIPVLFICAVGIAVRVTSMFVVCKYTDSPVVVLDDMGKFAVSLLSGHAGGANELTKRIAQSVGAVPVITTSTDLHDKFAVDLFAKYNGLHYEDGEMVKRFSAALLNGGQAGVCAEPDCYEGRGKLPSELCVKDSGKKQEGYGMMITPFVRENVFEHTLTLVPKQITLGIGCRKNVSLEEVESAVFKTLEEHRILPAAVKQVCSVRLKKNEEGILRFCEKYNLPFVTFSPQELETVQGSVSPSEFVKGVTGVDNVCERSALFGSGGKLIVPKQAEGKVTVAAAIEKVYLDFETYECQR